MSSSRQRPGESVRLQPERLDHRRGPQGKRLGCASITAARPWRTPTRKSWPCCSTASSTATRACGSSGSTPTPSSRAYRDSAEDELRKRQNWQEAFALVAGEDAVLTGEASADQLERKGYKPVQGPGKPGPCRRAVRCADAGQGAVGGRTRGPARHRSDARRSGCRRSRVGMA